MSMYTNILKNIYKLVNILSELFISDNNCFYSQDFYSLHGFYTLASFVTSLVYAMHYLIYYIFISIYSIKK
jgi:hypothetical protein